MNKVLKIIWSILIILAIIYFIVSGWFSFMVIGDECEDFPYARLLDIIIAIFIIGICCGLPIKLPNKEERK